MEEEKKFQVGDKIIIFRQDTTNRTYGWEEEIKPFLNQIVVVIESDSISLQIKGLPHVWIHVDDCRLAETPHRLFEVGDRVEIRNDFKTDPDGVYYDPFKMDNHIGKTGIVTRYSDSFVRGIPCVAVQVLGIGATSYMWPETSLGLLKDHGLCAGMYVKCIANGIGNYAGIKGHYYLVTKADDNVIGLKAENEGLDTVYTGSTATRFIPAIKDEYDSFRLYASDTTPTARFNVGDWVEITGKYEDNGDAAWCDSMDEDIGGTYCISYADERDEQTFIQLKGSCDKHYNFPIECIKKVKDPNIHAYTVGVTFNDPPNVSQGLRYVIGVDPYTEESKIEIKTVKRVELL